MLKKIETYIFIVITITVCILFMLNYFEPLEVKTQDFRFKRNINQKVSENVVLVTITDEDIENYGPWPFKRSIHARLIDYLKNAGAAVIGFDIIFSLESEMPEDDNIFVKSLQAAGNVVLANRFIRSERLIDTNTYAESYDIDDSHPRFKEAALASGFVNVDFEELNPDGVIRNVELVKKIDGSLEIALSLKLALELMSRRSGMPIKLINEGLSLNAGGVRIPIFDFYNISHYSLKKSSAYIVKFNGNSRTGLFPEFSYTQIFNSTEKELPKTVFKDKVVIIGAQSALLPDIKLSPLGTIPGMEINAQIIDNVICEDFVIRPPRLISALILVLLGTLVFYFLIRNEPNFFDVLYLSAYVAAVLGVTYFLYSKAMILFETIAPLAEILILFIVTRFYQLFIKLHLTNIDLKVSNKKLEQKVTELSALYDISKTITTISDMNALFRMILEKTINIVNAEKGFIITMDEEDGILKNFIELEIESVRVTGLEPVYSIMQKEKKTAVYSRGELSNDKINSVFMVNPNLKSMAAIPLTSYKGDLTGVIVLLNKKDGDIFSDNDIQLTSVIAAQAGFAIENANLYQLAVFDSLTALYVRRYFLGFAGKEFKRIRRYGGSLSLLMTDIDHFKKFNDTYGHQTGDLVLKSVAGVVKKTVRETDMAARYGGEEFIVLLPETDPAGAMIFAGRLRKAVESSVFLSESGPLKVTVSIGVSSFVFDKNDKSADEIFKDIKGIDDMIKFADIALYNSKEAGRNTATLYVDGMNAKG